MGELDVELVVAELFELLIELGALDLLEEDCVGTEELLTLDALRDTEHSFTPPAIRAPNVASEHTKLPERTL